MAKWFRSLSPKPARRQAGPPAAGAKPAAAGDPAPPGAAGAARSAGDRPREIGGPEGPEPTRYGDWERGGICYDF